MERRYLVAALAIIATFAVFSRGLRTLERVSLSYGQHSGADLRAKCNSDASAASRFIGKVRTHLRPGYAEEAQLLAEMNLPIAMVQAKVAEQVARQVAEQVAQQNIAASQCARVTALREAERAQREATRMRDKMAHASGNASAMPIAWGANMAANMDQRVQARTVEFAQRIAAQTVRLQMAAGQMREASVDLSDSDVPRAAVAQHSSNDAGSKVRCKAAQSR